VASSFFYCNFQTSCSQIVMKATWYD